MVNFLFLSPMEAIIFSGVYNGNDMVQIQLMFFMGLIN